MGDANMKCWFKEVKYPAGQPEDPECTIWDGIIDFAASNGSYAAAYPFVNLVAGPGDITPVNQLIYNGIGGYCGAGRVQLAFRVTVGGFDPAHNHVVGSNTAVVIHPPTPVGSQVSISYSVPVTVINSVTGKKATKWYVFTVITMC